MSRIIKVNVTAGLIDAIAELDAAMASADRLLTA